MKRFLLAAAASAAAIVAAAPASAVTYTTDLGSITVPPSAFFQPGFDIQVGAVDAFYTFRLNSALTLNDSSFTSSRPAITFNSVALYSGTLNTVPTAGTTPIASSTTQMTLGTSNGIALGTTSLQQGSYTILVRGNASAATGLGSSISFEAAAVPEPATWGLMLAGFGMIGFGLRARKAAKVSFA